MNIDYESSLCFDNQVTKTMPVRLLSDLEEEILCRVPYRSLARFRSVCKLWNSLILEERLLQKNLSRTDRYSGEHRLIIVHGQCILSSVSIEEQKNVVDPLSLKTENLTLRRIRPDGPIRVYKIVHCDGLLLCVMDNQLLVWNPLLKETRWVKCGSDFHEYDDAYSLGYLSHCDYRILRFRCASNSRNRPPRVEVYQLATKTWKVIDMISFDWILKTPLSILSLRGTPYWIGVQEDHTAFIQSFDFSKERFQPIDHLPFRYDKLNPIALDIFKGDRLSVLEQCHKTRKICIWVKHWRLSWSRLMVVAIPHFPLLYPPLCHSPTHYFFEKGNRLIITSIDIHNKISIKTVIDDGRNDFQTIEAGIMGHYWPFSCNYVPSLVRCPGFLSQDTSRIRWRRNRFN